MVNLDNLRAWTTELRITTRPQVTGYLGQIEEVKEDGTRIIGNCCLGIGTELAGVTPDEVTYEDGNGVERESYMGDALDYLGCQEFPPADFFEWLESVPDYKGDVVIDWPLDGYGRPALSTPSEEGMAWTASELNDEVHLTFSQIADVLDYFGVRQ